MKRKYKEFKKENCQKKRDERKERVGKKFATEAKKRKLSQQIRGANNKRKKPQRPAHDSTDLGMIVNM